MARLMSSTELCQRLDSEDDFVLVDVLPPEQYEKEHIPGAINIPLELLSAEAARLLNKNQRIIVYGDNHDGVSSNSAAQVLERMGYRKVSDFDGGIYAWKRAGFKTSVESSPRS